MFTPGAELNLAILYDVSNPMAAQCWTHIHHIVAQDFGREEGTERCQRPGTGGVTRGSPITAKHPPGSCTNHPNSTTHTTAECKKK